MFSRTVSQTATTAKNLHLNAAFGARDVKAQPIPSPLIRILLLLPTLMLSLHSEPARAQQANGGTGGSAGTVGGSGQSGAGVGGGGGAGGVLAGASGGNGINGTLGGAGGGGGGGQYGNGSGAVVLANGGSLVGGNGGNGGGGSSGAGNSSGLAGPGGAADQGGTGGLVLDGNAGGNGGGGAGGAGALVTGSGTVNSNSGSVIGGNGGNGGVGEFGAFSASGGGGGSGVVFSGTGNTFTNGGGASVSGGTGGTTSAGSGNNTGEGGAGGHGTSGVGLTVLNNGSISGGTGGIGGFLSRNIGGAGGDGIHGTDLAITNNVGATISGGTGGGTVPIAGGGPVGLGGAGISGSNVTIVNAGAISGGLNGNGVVRADAITFSGGTNRLELRAGWSVVGRVNAFTGSNSFALGGTTNSSFDTSALGSQFQGFQNIEKTGTSTWTLTGAAFTFVPWSILGGTLQIENDDALGFGSLTIANGSTLATTASFASGRTITLDAGGGVLDVAPGTALTLVGTIDGTGGLSKVNTGTLILTGDNVYTGGTFVSSGTLQLGDGGVSGGIVGDVANDGTFAFNRSGEMTFDGIISGNGGVAQIGEGTTVLAGTNSYSGATNILAGTLQAGAPNTFSSNSAVTVAGAGVLDLGGFSQTIAGLTSAGLVTTGDGIALRTALRVNGNVVGLGGTLALNSFLGSDGSPSDTLIINGGTATGNSLLRIANSGGGGEITNGNGILVIDAIGGATTAPGAFSLDLPVVAGPYEYLLFQGSVDAAGVQNWYLRSTLDCTLAPAAANCQQPPPVPPAPPIPDYRQEVSLAVAMPALAALYGRHMIDTLHERQGDRNVMPGTIDLGEAAIAWGRLLGISGVHGGDPLGIYGVAGPSFDYTLAGLQAGIDLYRHNDKGVSDVAGGYIGFGSIAGTVEHNLPTRSFEGGTDGLTAFSLGGYWTRTWDNAAYVDAVAQASLYNFSLDSHRRLPVAHFGGLGVAGSLEAGYPLTLGEGWILEPQVQAIAQVFDISDFSDGAAGIGYDDTSSLVGRIGARLGRRFVDGDGHDVSVWARINLFHEFLGRSTTSFSSAHGPVLFSNSLDETWTQLGLGADIKINSASSLFGQVSYDTTLTGSSHALEAKFGLKGTW